MSVAHKIKTPLVSRLLFMKGPVSSCILGGDCTYIVFSILIFLDANLDLLGFWIINAELNQIPRDSVVLKTNSPTETIHSAIVPKNLNLNNWYYQIQR